MKDSRAADCHETANKLYEFIDGELASDVEDAVRTHLSNCTNCTSLFNFENVFVKFLRARTRARAAPAHLRRHVFEAVVCEEDQSESS